MVGYTKMRRQGGVVHSVGASTILKVRYIFRRALLGEADGPAVGVEKLSANVVGGKC
jgi:hypothetical protein